MATEEAADKHFPFFSLPPELRDMCYDFMATESKVLNKETCGRSAIMSIENYPLPNILCVNRQMHSEYSKRLLHPITLVLSDHAAFSLGTELDLELLQPNKIERVAYTGVLRCSKCLTRKQNIRSCNLRDEILELGSWLRDDVLYNLSAVGVLELRLGLWGIRQGKDAWPSTSHRANLEAELGSLTDLRLVSSLIIYQHEDEDEDVNDRPGSEQIFVTWTKEGGWKANESFGKHEKDEDESADVPMIEGSEETSA